VTTFQAEMALEQRLTDLLGRHDVHPELRGQIQRAFQQYRTWDKLPPDIKTMITEAEKLPRQSWADPADMPDNALD
jgi:hypothetical protein